MAMCRWSGRPSLALVFTLVFALVSAEGVAAQSRSAKGTAIGEQYRQAARLMAAGNLQGALGLVDGVLIEHPRDVDFLLLQGQANEESGNTDAALAAFERAEAVAPADPKVLFFLGSHWFDRRQLDRAIPYFEKCLRSWPKSVEANAFLSDSYRAKQNLPQALIHAQRAAALAPLDAELAQKAGEIFCLSGDFDTGLGWLLKARQINASLKQLDFEIGKTYANLQEFSKAVEALRRAMQRTPLDVDVQFCLAENLTKVASWSDASDSFKAMVKIAPADPRGYLGLGRSYIALGQLQAGEISLQKALEINPSLAEAHWQLSRLYLKQNRKDLSTREAMIFDSVTRHAATKSPGLPGDLGGLQHEIGERCARLLAENKEDDAMALLQSLPGVDTGSIANQLLNLGVVYLSMDRYADAERVLQKAYRANSKGAGIQSVLGATYLASRQWEKAEKAFQSELTISANDQQSLAGLGQVRYLQQRWAEAAELLEQSKTGAPASLFLLCDSYFQLGKTEEALVVAETLAAVDRREGVVRQPLAQLLRKWNQPDAAARLRER